MRMRNRTRIRMRRRRAGRRRRRRRTFILKLVWQVLQGQRPAPRARGEEPPRPGAERGHGSWLLRLRGSALPVTRL